jgi:stage III sporulation protein AE
MPGTCFENFCNGCSVQVTCVLIEPIAEKRITGCINDIANSLTFVLGIVASVAFMFLITITAIITAEVLQLL